MQFQAVSLIIPAVTLNGEAKSYHCVYNHARRLEGRSFYPRAVFNLSAEAKLTVCDAETQTLYQFIKNATDLLLQTTARIIYYFSFDRFVRYFN
jgi:hypothetical protein